uniref:Rep74 n=1 Tax=Thermococcus nautili TaxID=195522 RepID=A6MV72_9EURY|nr:Rep74 [Thermococcus nautili]AVP12420.1 Rep74 [E. coli-T. kodakarensis shuttle vector pTNAg]AVP12425.1 Rep74 [E. coli-T. kodakarensis shuttle vector pTNTrpE]
MRLSNSSINSLLSSGSCDVVGSSPSGSPFLPQSTGSTQKTLSVYLDISPTNEKGEPSVRGPTIRVSSHPLPAYAYYRSATGHLERQKFESQGRVKIDIYKLRKKLFWIRRRLERVDLTDEERSSLEAERDRLVSLTEKLLRKIYSGSALYGDRFVIDVPVAYSQLCKALGINPSDVGVSLFVRSAVMDLEFDDSSRSALKISYVSRLFAGKYHPAKGISKGFKEARRVVRDLLVLQEFLDGSLLSYHKGDYVTSNSLLPMRFFVLTLPEEISYYIWSKLREGDDSALKLFKKISSQAIRDFLFYLAQKEGIPINKSYFVPGFLQNIHPTGDRDPFKPHFHAHFSVVFVVYDKSSHTWYRLNPVLDEADLEKLREIWKALVVEAFSEILSGDTLTKDFNVWVGDRYYSLPHDYVGVLFEIKYNARKMFVNYSSYYERNSFSDDFDRSFVSFIFDYKNRTERYGFLTNIKRYLSRLSISAVKKRLEELRELLDRIEADLLVVDSGRFPLLYQSLLDKREAVQSEISRLESVLNNPDDAFRVLYDEISRDVESMLSPRTVKENRIVSLLESLHGKRVVGLSVEYIRYLTRDGEEVLDVPLHKFLEARRSVVLLSDRHKTVEFMLWWDPFWEDPPDVLELKIPNS